tara:strand:- start:67 stop:189 length:123 start_codon:yes stop_codon:yes gene_type:complete
MNAIMLNATNTKKLPSTLAGLTGKRLGIFILKVKKLIIEK